MKRPIEIEHDCTPGTRQIWSFMNASIERDTCICELVDNSFDARAQLVTITFAKDEITVDDNGRGHAAVLEIIDIAGTESDDDSPMRSGRYGVGFKDATIKLADVVEVDGRTKEMRSICRVDWRALLKSKVWRIKGTLAEINTGLPEGVRVTMSRLRDPEQWTPNAIAKLLRHLNVTYLPALREGRRILIVTPTGTMEAEAPDDPDLEFAQQVEGSFGDGVYGYTGDAGLVSDDGDPGIFVYYGARRLQEMAAPKGASRFRANIYLWEKRRFTWELTRNKTGIASMRQRSALLADIAEKCKTLLERARVEPWVLKGLSLIDGAPTRTRQDPPRPHPESEKPEEPESDEYEPSAPGRPKKPRALEEGEKPAKGGTQIVVQPLPNRDRLGNANAEGQVYINTSNRFVDLAWQERESDESNLAAIATKILVEAARESNDVTFRKKVLGELSDMSDADVAKVAEGRLLDLWAAKRPRRRRKKDEDA